MAAFAHTGRNDLTSDASHITSLRTLEFCWEGVCVTNAVGLRGFKARVSYIFPCFASMPTLVSLQQQQ